jgi:hypothetical protein
VLNISKFNYYMYLNADESNVQYMVNLYTCFIHFKCVLMFNDNTWILTACLSVLDVIENSKWNGGSLESRREGRGKPCFSFRFVDTVSSMFHNLLATCI